MPEKIVNTGAFKVCLDPFESWAMAMRAKGGYEPRTAKFITDHLSPSGLFVDIGANKGYFSAMAAMTGARVLAFEPDQDNAESWKTTMLANKITRARIEEVALSDQTGYRPWYQGRKSGMGSLIQGQNAPLSSYQVEIKPLDWYFELTAGVQVIKIDVEGSELDVLRGARGTISRDHPAITVEIHHNKQKPAEVRQFLESYGYQVTKVPNGHKSKKGWDSFQAVYPKKVTT